MSLALSGSAASRRSPVSATAAEGSSFKAQPRDARIFIGGVFAIGMVALFLQPPGTSYAHPGAFVLLLTLAAIAALFKVELPLSHHGATMSLSFAFEFASLLMLGPHATMLSAATTAWVQSTAGGDGRNPLHRTMFSMAALVVTALVASRLPAARRSAGYPGAGAGLRNAGDGRGDELLRAQYVAGGDGRRPRERTTTPQGLERSHRLRAQLRRRCWGPAGGVALLGQERGRSAFRWCRST
jgi:hypothetical protein